MSLNYQDYLGNPVSSDIETLVTIDTTVIPPTVNEPESNTTIRTSSTMIDGTCESGATVTLSSARLIDSPISATCTDGVYSASIRPTFIANDSEIEISLSQTDQAGNISESTSHTLIYTPKQSSG